MSLRMYADENVLFGIVHGLRMRGVDVLTAQEDGRAGAADLKILMRATELNRVLFTQDVDYLGIVAALNSLDRDFAGVVYAKQGRLSIRECIDELELIAFCSDPEHWRGQLRHLPL